MNWKPHVTVAAVIERDGRFLMVEEQAHGCRVFNQPAGHLEPGEGLIEATIRETFEETAWHFEPQGVVGLYRYTTPRGRTYLRICLHGSVRDHQPDTPLDDGIHRALWLSRDDLAADPARLRSPMVLRCIDDYLAGRRHPLSLISEVYDEASD